MTKNNKNKGKNPKPIPLTKYTNMLVGKEIEKALEKVDANLSVEDIIRKGLLNLAR